MRAFTGIWTTGMTSQMLPTKMKMNSVAGTASTSGPSWPIVCRMIPSWTKSTADSATFCTPVGTSCAPALATKKNGEDDQRPTPTSAARPC